MAVVRREPDRPANPRVMTGIFRQRCAHDAFADICLDQYQRLAIIGRTLADRTYVERRMRLCRLRHILDSGRKLVCASDEEDVAGPQCAM